MINRSGDIVHFRFHADVEQLYLTGSLNGWKRTPMHRNSDGWACLMQLKPGEYQFRYVGRDKSGKEIWFTDCAAEGLVENPFGGLDSLVHIPDLKNN